MESARVDRYLKDTSELGVPVDRAVSILCLCMMEGVAQVLTDVVGNNRAEEIMAAAIEKARLRATAGRNMKIVK